MTESKNKKSKHDQEFNEFLDILDPYTKNKFESDLSQIFEDMEKDNNLSMMVEKLIDECYEVTELHSKLILLLKKYIHQEAKKDPKTSQNIDSDEKKVTRDIEEISRKLLQKINIEPDEKLGRLSQKDRIHILDQKTKKNLKDRMKDFVLYEIYKIMNPKRIAGETSKANYKHNLIVGGQKLASKYEGGTKKYVKKYGSIEMNKLRKQVSDFQKNEKEAISRLK